MTLASPNSKRVVKLDSGKYLRRETAVEFQANNWSSVLPAATASLSHLGWLPRPVHVFPAPSLYFTATDLLGAVTFALAALFFAAFDVDGVTSLDGLISASATAKSESAAPFASALRSQTGRGPRPTHVLPVPSANFAVKPNFDFDLDAGLGATTDFGVDNDLDFPPNRSSSVMPYADIATRIFAMTSASSDFRMVSASDCSFAICAWSCE